MEKQHYNGEKIKGQIVNLLKKFQTIPKKTLYSIGGLIGFTFLLIVLYFSTGNEIKNNIINKFIGNFIPKVEYTINGANFDFSMKKIPYDLDYFQINFSKELDKSTITGEILSISPKIQGTLLQDGPNSIKYVLSQPLEKDKSYEIFISKDIKSKDGEKLIEDKVYLLKTTDPAKVVKTLPEGSLQDLSKNITAIFNLPLVPVTNLENNYKLPCPLKITPETKGVCKWTTTNMIEFTPFDGFQGSTDYSISIENVDGLMYNLTGTYNSKFSTPDLKIFTGGNNDIEKGIELISNFQIDTKELEGKLKLLQGGKQIPFVIMNSSESKSIYYILPKNELLTFEKKYEIVIEKGLMPKFGNRGTKEEFSFQNIEFKFLKNVEIYKNIYSITGDLIDNKFINYNSGYQLSSDFYYDEYYQSEYGYLPVKDIMFYLNFEKQVNLDKKYFSLTDLSGNTVEFDLEFVNHETENFNGLNFEKEIKANKNIIKFLVKSSLKNNQIYKLKISKELDKNISNDIIKEFQTSPELQVLSYIPIDYTKSCIYTTNPIRLNINKTKISTIPESRFAGFDEYIPWGINEEGKKIESKEKQDKYYLDNGYCPLPKSGEYLTTLNTRLNPNSKYEIILSGDIVDIYGNSLGNNSTKTIETQNIKPQDIYTYSSLSKYINIIPNNIPIVINIQTLNTSNIDFQLCETDIDGYLYFKEKGVELLFENYCKNVFTKKLNINNQNWVLSHNKFDLETDIYGKKLSKNYIFIRGTGTEFESGYGKDFFNLFIRNNLTMNLEEGTNENILFVTDLYGEKIKDNLNFKIYDYLFDSNKNDYYYKENLKFKASFNKEKQVYNLTGINDSQIIVAYNENDYGIINKSNDYMDNYSYNFVGGNTSYAKNFLYLYTDRPLYKPGEKVYYKGVLREFSYQGYRKSKETNGKLFLMDNSRNIIKEIQINIDENGNFDGAIELGKDIKLGEFKFDFQLENGEYVSNNGNFFVEEFQNPVFKIDIEQDKNELEIGDKTKITIFPTYYFGGKIINTTGNVRILKQNYYFNPKDYSEYQFGKGYEHFNCLYWGDCNFYDELFEFSNYTIGKDGLYNLDYTYEGEKHTGEKMYNFTFNVMDPDTKKSVSKSTSQILHQTDGYIGIKGSYWNPKDNVTGKGIMLDWYGKPLKSKNVEIQLMKRDWQNVKKQGIDGIFYSEYSLIENVESSQKLISNEKGEIEFKFSPKQNGEYAIIGIYTGKNNLSYVSEQIIYVAGEETSNWQIDNNNITEIIGEKIMLNVGDSQDYIIKSPVNNGKAIIYIQKDDGIIDYFIHEIQTNGDRINIKVKPDYYPNFYVKAFLVGKETNNPLPIYKRALTITKVNTDYKNLNVNIKTNKTNYNPGESVELLITVKDNQGNVISGANGSISIVDQSLLALKGNPKKNPFAYFYDIKRGLRTNSYSNLVSLIERLEVKDASSGIKGGDGEDQKGGKSTKKRGVFKNTAYWLANYKTNEKGEFKIITESLPDNLTTWEIETIVNDGETRIGIDQETIMTTKKLLINDNLPRFLGTADKIVLNPVIFNKTGKDGTFNINIEGEGLIIEKNTQQINIKDGEQKTVYFISTINNDTQGHTTIKISAEGNEYKDEIEKILPIGKNSSKEQISTSGKLYNNEKTELVEISRILNNQGKLTINYSPSLIGNILDGIDYLNNFPYGCLEQNFSSFMPNVYIKYLYEALNKEYNLDQIYIEKLDFNSQEISKISIENTIKQTLSELSSYQSMDGGFVYWLSDNSKGDFNLTSYIIESIGKIKGLGYKYDENIVSKAILFLKNDFYKGNHSEVEKLESLIGILSYQPNDYEIYKMWKNIKFEDSIEFKIANLKVILRLLKIKEIGEMEKKALDGIFINDINHITNNYLVLNPRGAYIDIQNGNSRVKNSSDYIYLISEYGIEKFEGTETIVDNCIKWLLTQKNNGSFGSTQLTIGAIKSIVSYVKTNHKGEDYQIELQVNSEKNESLLINNENKFNSISKIIDFKQLSGLNTIKFNLNGIGSLFYDINLNYYVDSNELKSIDQGFRINTKYFRYEDYKLVLSEKEKEQKLYIEGKIPYDKLKYPKEVFNYISPVDQGKIGELIIVLNEISTGETRDKVAYESYIPSGTELVNPNLTSESGEIIKDEYDTIFTTKEFRNDRFYGYTNMLTPGSYKHTYILRFTHAGDYNIKPSRIYEFYNEEVFGRNEGKKIQIKQ